ncbi:MAG: isochorismate synthase [Cyanosarcina radialis HA8281-LM2]|nr:isochorismate synthase [Cyanosarcina radialis HA8281-LM2]
MVRQTFDFIAAAARRIFAPTDDKYPATGIQPFEGDIYEERREKRHQN